MPLEGLGSVKYCSHGCHTKAGGVFRCEEPSALRSIPELFGIKTVPAHGPPRSVTHLRTNSMRCGQKNKHGLSFAHVYGGNPASPALTSSRLPKEDDMKINPNSELAVDLLDMVVLIHNKIRNEV